MKQTYSILIFILISMMFWQCIKDEIETPVADFLIETDSIIDGKKQRIEVSEISEGTLVYFVPKGNSMFNSIWPGDSIMKNDLTIYQDYDLKKNEIILGINKVDSLMQMKSNQFQGIALPFGSTELAYSFVSKGVFTVTWVATNTNEFESKTAIAQKIIHVK
ncbi:MAG: hypothetical protein HC906_09575 [Bacteroidales bacterium]|nr:hypothetical protein [Bacteroidales bacterium]